MSKRTPKQDHKRVNTLVHRMSDIPGPVVEWSDGDKLRFLVISKFVWYQRQNKDCGAMHDDDVAWEVLRIADRLDALDEAERGPMPSLDAEIGGTT